MQKIKGNTFIYRCRQHLNRNKRLKYQWIIKNHKDNLKITTEENKLSDYNSKSCILNKFKEFIKKKNELNDVLLEKYKDEKFRQYKWYSYMQKKRAEDRLINDIKEKYSKSTVLIIGDWDAKSSNGIKRISVPNKGLKRKLSEHFTIYMIDEFRTSCLHYKTENRCENMYVNDKKGVSRKLHSVLTFKAENNRLGCINRDENATNNMIKIVKSYLKDKTRPLNFCRNSKLDEDLKKSSSTLEIYKGLWNKIKTSNHLHKLFICWGAYWTKVDCQIDVSLQEVQLCLFTVKC